MYLKEFAAANRLKTKNTGAEDIIPGKYGELAEMNDGGLLRLRLLAVPRSAIMTGSLRNRRRLAEAGGLEPKWRGDSESIWIFDPADPEQAALAIKLVHPKRKRVVNLTEEQRQVLRDRLKASRRKKPTMPECDRTNYQHDGRVRFPPWDQTVL
jgi:hypothetical protein